MAAWWWSWLLAGVGLAGLWLAGSRRRVGWAVGVAAQVLWVAYALATGQYGFLASVLGYGFVYARNWWRWRTPQPAAPPARGRHAITSPPAAHDQPHAMVNPSGDVYYPAGPGDARWFANRHDAEPLHPDRFPAGWLP